MKSNYKRIGDHIKLVDERNRGLRIKQLLGLSISKQFIPSVANIIGTDMENYKIIRKNQFACSTMQVRRDKKMPVALLQDIDEAIISQAYPVFEVKDEKQLLPEYLMMWFTRSEFDREACFHAVGGVRGSLEWEDFENMQLPIPSITKQREIVKEYNTIQNRIALNQQLIQKLEETAQAIYKQWFVEFEFPDENGNPYKSNGDEMVWNEELGKEIPKSWNYITINELMDLQGGSQPPAEEFIFAPKENYIRFIQIRDYSSDDNITYIPETHKNKHCDIEDIMIARYGASLGRICSGIKGAYNVALMKIIPNKRCFREYLRCYLNTSDFYNQLVGIGDGKSAREGFGKEELFLLKVPFPIKDEYILSMFEKNLYSLFIYKQIVLKENKVLSKLSEIHLAKMAAQ